MKKENANLVVAKMDATANDVHPLFHPLIKGYPSIFFLPVGNKDEPILFNTTTSLNYKALKVPSLLVVTYLIWNSLCCILADTNRFQIVP